jgi:carboxyl-terminal processing protease
MPMKSWAIRIQTIIILSLSMLLFSAVAIAKDSSGVDLSRYASAEEARLAGEQLENSHQWVEAITLYEAAIEEWKDDEGLTYALRRTRIHFGVERRYSDRSFENQLLTKGRAEALDLYEDILSRVQYEYVDSISVTRFAAHGTESLYMALKNDKFLSRNVKPGNDDGVERVRSI